MLTGWFPPMCPECRSGKCRNCIGWTLDADDREVDCECPYCPKEGTHLMTDTLRPLDVRLREYADAQRETIAGLGRIIEAVEAERMDVNPQTSGLRETAKLLGVVADDIDKMLAGEDLVHWAFEVEIPKGGK